MGLSFLSPPLQSGCHLHMSPFQDTFDANNRASNITAWQKSVKKQEQKQQHGLTKVMSHSTTAHQTLEFPKNREIQESYFQPSSLTSPVQFIPLTNWDMKDDCISVFPVGGHCEQFWHSMPFQHCCFWSQHINCFQSRWKLLHLKLSDSFECAVFE